MWRRVTIILILMMVLIDDVTSTCSRHDDRRSLQPTVDIESNDDQLVQRDQPIVSHTVCYVTAAAACHMLLLHATIVRNIHRHIATTAWGAMTSLFLPCLLSLHYHVILWV